MKAVILLFLLLISLCGFTQQSPNVSVKESLITKSNNQRTGAWVMLGGGGVLAGGGLLIFANDINNSDEGLSLFGPFVSVLGLTSMICSIPMFAASARNRKKAAAITLSTQQIIAPVKGGWAYRYSPAITFKVPIGKR